jgi:hypothetical protein
MLEAAKVQAVSDNPAADRAVYYREMAAKARARAEAMMDYEARRAMLEVAELWETMAKNAERNARH